MFIRWTLGQQKIKYSKFYISQMVRWSAKTSIFSVSSYWMDPNMLQNWVNYHLSSLSLRDLAWSKVMFDNLGWF